MRKIDNPQYYRLFKTSGGIKRGVGNKRVITEYLANDGNRWQREPIDHDPDENIKLQVPPSGIEVMPRASFKKEKE